MNDLYNALTSPSPRRGRPPRQQQAIANDLRRQIARETLAPGARLPSHNALIERYGVSLVTVQRAMRLLEREGFIRSAPGQGRFVTSAPPARVRFGLVFPGRPMPAHSRQWTRLFAAQLAAARQLGAGGPCEWEPWFNVNREENGRYSLEHDQLLEAVEQRRLAGVLFATSPHRLRGSPLLEQRLVPMAVAKTRSSDDETPLSISHDGGSFLSLVVDHLTRVRRRRVAWLTPLRFSLEHMLNEVRRVGRSSELTIRREWVASADPYHPDWLEHSLGVLLTGPARRRPNAIIVRDDHLLEPALRALRTLGVAVPDDVTVIGHWNFPLAYEADMPAYLVGFDAGEQLARAHELLIGKATGPVEVPARTAASFRERGGQPMPLSEVCDPRVSSRMPMKGDPHA